MPRRYDNVYAGSTEKMGNKAQRGEQGGGAWALRRNDLKQMDAALAFGAIPSVRASVMGLGVDGQNDTGKGG